MTARTPPQTSATAKRLDGANVVVVGLGASGEAAALLARAKGATVTVTETRIRSAVGGATAERLEAKGITLVLGGHAGIDLVSADLVVVSPGVPNQPFLREAERRGARLVSEIELASWYVDADLVAIGGTNGKSTTTELAAALARTSGRAVFAGGNLGIPLAHAVLQQDAGVLADGIAVVEVSSFQLERVAGFRPRSSVLLNVTADHLDRYPSFEAYAAAKAGAFRAQTERDAAIVPHGDELCARIAMLGGGRLERVDGPAGEATIGLEGTAIVDRVSNVRMSREDVHLAGRHNITNLCAAWAAVRALGLDATRFPAAVADFRGLPHRTVLVSEVDGVRYYDDSKGTNVGAAVTAVSGLSEARVVLIAGGRDKGGSYAPLMEALRAKGCGLVLIGEAAAAIEKSARAALGASFPVEKASSMEAAVEAARGLSRAGDAVLLSPACSSFDMFRDYKHRGDVFTAAVQALASRKGTTKGAP
jgi:UDP-N-acetylmuramoylalanine--D-glutamate ligase